MYILPNCPNSQQVPQLASRPRVYSGPGMAIPTLQGMFKTPSRVVRNRVVKYEASALFWNLYDSCMSVRMLLLLACVHSLGLGVDLGNSLE